MAARLSKSIAHGISIILAEIIRAIHYLAGLLIVLTAKVKNLLHKMIGLLMTPPSHPVRRWDDKPVLRFLKDYWAIIMVIFGWIYMVSSGSVVNGLEHKDFCSRLNSVEGNVKALGPKLDSVLIYQRAQLLLQQSQTAEGRRNGR